MSLSTGMHRFILALGFVVLCLILPVTADEWVASEPVSFHSRGFGYVAEIFPPLSRQNSTEKPLCYFYEVGYPGTAWKIDAKLKWKAPLVNDLMPYQAVVSMQGRLVTFDEHGAAGYKNAVAIYSPTGSLVARYQLDEFIPAADIGKIETSESSRWWTKDAKYYFLESPSRLYIVLSWGKVVEFSLDTGRHKYGTMAEFSDLAKVMAKGNYVNEETEIWATSLRFSSITDLMEATGIHGSPHSHRSRRHFTNDRWTDHRRGDFSHNKDAERAKDGSLSDSRGLGAPWEGSSFLPSQFRKHPRMWNTCLDNGSRSDENWHQAFQGRLARVEIQRTLYEPAKDCIQACY